VTSKLLSQPLVGPVSPRTAMSEDFRFVRPRRASRTNSKDFLFTESMIVSFSPVLDRLLNTLEQDWVAEEYKRSYFHAVFAPTVHG
jgi:hypothetical protein